MTEAERQILLNQIAIMAGLKHHMILQHGNGLSEAPVARFDVAIANTAEILRDAGKSR